MSDAGFLAEIAAAPDDPAPYLIYSDALQLRGDPRGDLISIQHALETAAPAIAADLRRREAELVEHNRDAWLGPLLERRDELAVRWRYGFLHAVRILDDGSPATLRALLDTEAVASTLAELRIGPHDEDEWPSCQALIDEPWPPALRRLYVNDVDLRGMHLAAPVRIPERAKQLDLLVVQSPSIELAWDSSPAQLRSIELRGPHFEGLFAVREWPRLESLVVWTADASGVMRMLSRAKLPRLRHLGLCGTANTAVLATELARHPIAAQLASLDLRGGTLTMSKALQPIASRVQLDVRFNALGKREREQLAAFGANVQPQRRGKAPLTDREALTKLYMRTRGDCYEDPPSGDRDEAYAKLVAASPDPTWLWEGREYLAGRMKAREKRAILAELVGECEHQLLQPGDSDLVDIYYTLGEISDALVEGYEAEAWLWKAVGEARWSGATRTEIRALGLIGTTRMRRGDPVHAATIMDRVLAYFLAHGRKEEQAWALRQRGNVDLVRSEYDTAEGFYRRALALYREQNDRANESIVLSELAGVLWSRQDFEGAVAMIREGISMKPEGSLGLGSSYYNLGAVLNGMGRLEESREAASQSLAIFRKHKRRDGEGQALSLLGELAQRSNRHDEAQQLLDEALACHRERGAVRESGITLGNLARVALDRAQYARARAYAEEAVELHRECGNKYNEGMQLLDGADAAIGERRLDDALALATEALVPLLAINNLPALAAVKCRRGYVAQLRGDFDEAERHYDEAIADSKQGNYPEQVGWTELYRAIIRAQQGRLAEAHALVAAARPYLADSLQGMQTLAMTEAVIARLTGDAKTKLPEPLGFDAHLIASFAD